MSVAPKKKRLYGDATRDGHLLENPTPTTQTRENINVKVKYRRL